jgi:hypothetical protein
VSTMVQSGWALSGALEARLALEPDLRRGARGHTGSYRASEERTSECQCTSVPEPVWCSGRACDSVFSRFDDGPMTSETIRGPIQ